jgi:acetyltransferase-like isoleucine patch superfamily enzyme
MGIKSSDSGNKFKQEKLLGIIMKGVSLIRYMLNRFCLALLCSKVGGKAKVIQLPVITGGRNISVGDNVFIGRNVQFMAPSGSMLTIGDDVEIRDNVRLYAQNMTIDSGVTIGENTFLVGNIHLKSGCWISRSCDISGDVEIGKAIFGPRVSCISSDHARADDGAVCMDKQGASMKIIVEDGVWVGMNAIILKGVTLKKNSIVGAGSVVTKTTDKGDVVAGVPARKIESSLSAKTVL